MESARAIGVQNGRILSRAILPNILAPLIVIASFNVAAVILSEAALSFLGLGVPPEVPTWGGMLAESRDQLLGRLLVAGRLPRRGHHAHRALAKHPGRLAARFPRPAPARPLNHTQTWSINRMEYSADYKTVQIPLQYVPAEELRALTGALLRTTDLAPEDADIIADALVTSELRNLQGQGQGVRRVRAYVDRVRARHVDPTAPFDVVKESPALALIDAHNAAGTVVAVKAMRLAVQKAKACGVGIVLVRHSTHFGSASYSASQALADGCIGVSMTNAGPEMAPWGGIDGVVGTNPWAVAVPTGDGADAMPIILDMALTTAGKGMMRWLLRDGRKMPTNWAITADGRTTDDPAEAMDGTLLPDGRIQGLRAEPHHRRADRRPGRRRLWHRPLQQPGPPGSGAPVHRLRHRLVPTAAPSSTRTWRDFIGMVKASRLRPGVKEILLPGELEWRRQQEKTAGGIPLDPEVFEDLRSLAQECGVAWPF